MELIKLLLTAISLVIILAGLLVVILLEHMFGAALVAAGVFLLWVSM